MSKCQKCVFCVQGFINSCRINCKIYGNETRECYKCNSFVSKKEMNAYNKVNKVLKEK